MGDSLIKYLYGKHQFLKGFSETGKGLWFRDLYTMDKLNNESIKDDESYKSIYLEPNAIKSVTLAGSPFNVIPKDPIKFSQSPRRCHVLCLSNKANDPDLFKLFQADICIAIDVNKMVELIESANIHRNLEIVAKEITYYFNELDTMDCSVDELVFLKPSNPYSQESEFRIAVFWPSDDQSKIETERNGSVNVFGSENTKDDHIAFNFECSEFNQVVVNVTRT